MEPVTARLPLDRLAPHPRNVREGDVGAIVESLRAFGQYRPIVVQRRDIPGDPEAIVADEPLTIIAGTHTWLAHVALAEEDPERWGHIDVVALDVDDATALRIMLADNRTHDLGRDRQDDLAVLLQELGAPGWPGTGFDGDDLDTILRDLGQYDPAAGLLRAFDGVTGAGAEEGTFADATRTASPEHVVFTVSLTKAQRSVLMAAFKRAKADGYATQPEALEAMARYYTEGTR